MTIVRYLGIHSTYLSCLLPNAIYARAQNLSNFPLFYALVQGRMRYSHNSVLMRSKIESRLRKPLEIISAQPLEILVAKLDTFYSFDLWFKTKKI